MQEEFEFVRLVGNERRIGSQLASVSRHWQGDEERFLMISPHDDDAVLGAGLLIQVAKRENVPVHILIVTDGSMGYCSLEEKETIADIRRNESYRCYQSLGVPRQNIVGAFRSQRQISSLIENVRHCGPEEYIRAIDFRLYHPADYRNQFEETKTIGILH